MRTVLRTVITVILLTIVRRTLGPRWRCRSAATTSVPEAEHKADVTTQNQQEPTQPTTTPKPTPNQTKPLNILFLMADDLRPQLKKAYGKTFMHTPHLDAFTDTALVFDWAYTNYAICSASRNSMLSGRVPDKTRVWNFLNDFRETLSATAISLPQFFRQHGYVAVGHGKLYHPGRPTNNDLPYSWDAYPSGSTNSDCTGSPHSPHPEEDNERSHGGGNFCPDAESTPDQFSDVNVTQVAIQTIQNITAAAKRSGQPWFIGLGWHYPHQPWHVPSEYLELYPNPIDKLPAPKHPYSPIGMPDIAFSSELDGHSTMSLNESLPGFHASRPSGVTGMVEYTMPTPGNNTFPNWFTQQLRVGYYSAVSHMDAQFGQVLAALEASGTANETIVVMTGDHGWQLGEHTEYAKQTNFDLATHVPLLIRDPTKADTSAGQHASKTKAELVDLYRTLVALSGLPVADIETDVDGIDLSTVLDDPSLTLREYAFSQYARCPGNANWQHPVYGHPDWYMNHCTHVPAQNITYMGYTVRSSDYRYTMWFFFNGTICEPEWDAPLQGEELYSHIGHTDPGNFDDYENINLINDSNYSTVIEEHRTVLLQNFRGKNKRVGGCPPSPQNTTTSAVSSRYLPLQDNALILTRSQIAHDSELCGYVFCTSSHHPNLNYTTVSVEGFSPSVSQAIGIDRVELKLYWNNDVHDNLVSTKIPNKDIPLGYIDTGVVVGTVLREQVHGTMPVFVYYNKERHDHLTCASKSSLSYAKNNNYIRVHNEPIGFVYATPEWSESMY